MPGQPGELPKEGPDGKWYWSDGTEATWAEMESIKLQSMGYSAEDATRAVQISGSPDASGGITGYQPGDLGNVPDTTVKGYDTTFENMGYLPGLVTNKAPGAELDTSQAGEEELRLERLLGDLQQQATTGGGAWEGALKKATETAQATAQSLGQTVQNQTGGDYGSALRNIGNAQASAGQRAVGQGEILRAKSKMGAQDALTAVTSGMGKTAADQAAAQAAARRQVRGVNQELIDQAEKTTLGTVSGVTQAAMSEGGRVPGEPEVFGDDEVNDTEPAMLSPKEIVIPLSISTAPNAPDLARDFVAAIIAREGGQQQTTTAQEPQQLADGGFVDDEGIRHVEIGEMFTPSAKGNVGYQGLRDRYTPTSAGPRKKNKDGSWAESEEAYQARKKDFALQGGAALDTTGYNIARNAQNQNAALLEARARGEGPSVVPQMAQNTSDANIEAALQAQAAGKAGTGIVGQATAAQQGAAGDAGAMAAAEQAAGQEGAAKALLDQQARDNAFAIAQQQAAWQNTLMNVGMGLDQQARMQQLFSATGQGLAAASSLDFEDTDVSDDSDPFTEGDYDPFADAGSDEELGDFESGDDDSQYAAHGGRIKKKRGHEEAFAAAYGGRC